jgi:2-polyprenyl-3-methyl-5-hydroxy-6-metoxy-1,4-benzoquinol methylase
VDKQRTKQFMHKVVGDVATALAAALVIVGDRSGLFKAMAEKGPMSAEDLATRGGIPKRYAEEWLNAMASAGYVDHDASSDRFTLPDEHAQFFVDPNSEYYLGGLVGSVPALASMAPRIAEALHRGEGVSFAEFGRDLPVTLEQMNRAVYEARLTRTWLPALPAVHERLQKGGRAIDVGCGTGIVPITLAKAYPGASFAGLDLDAPTIAIARQYAEDEGVAARVSFIVGSAETMPISPAWDLVTTFDVIHDLPQPRATLARIRSALSSGGSYLMVEPRVADALEDNRGNAFARMFYGMSCLHCVPQSLAQGGPGLGAAWGETQARALAREAGFASFERLPIQTAGLAFYELKA